MNTKLTRGAFRRSIAAMAAIALIATACGGDDDDTAEPAAEPAAEPTAEPAAEPTTETTAAEVQLAGVPRPTWTASAVPAPADASTSNAASAAVRVGRAGSGILSSASGFARIGHRP